MLIEFHADTELREMMLTSFADLFEEFDSIPVAIVLEPLIKQIQISDNVSYIWNVFDLDFFRCLAAHKKLTIGLAVGMAEILSRIATSDLFFAPYATELVLHLLYRFQKDPPLHLFFS